MNNHKSQAKKILHPRRRVLIFEFAQRKCAIPASRAQEVVFMPLLAKGPGMPSILEGIMNLEGAATPVLRLDRLFGLPGERPGLYTPLIVLKAAQCQLAMMVDKMFEVRPVDGGEVAPSGGQDAFNGCVDALLNIDGETVHLLSVDRILLEREQKTIAEFQVIEQERLGHMGAWWGLGGNDRGK